MAEEEKNDSKELKREEKERKKAEKNKKKMEKKGADADYDDEEVEGKGAVIVVTLVIVLIWLFILGLLIKTDVGGFGSSVLTPLLKDVPYVNMVLPGSDATVSGSAVSGDAAAYTTVDSALAQIKVLEEELQKAKDAETASESTIADLQAEIERLKVFEENQAAYEELKAKFDKEVVFSDNAPDISEYKAYYESIDPTNAELLYKQVVEQTQYDAKVTEYAATYSAMKPKQAAAILETMTSNLDLVAQILENMDTAARGNILGAMDTTVAAKLTKLMAPDNTSTTN